MQQSKEGDLMRLFRLVTIVGLTIITSSLALAGVDQNNSSEGKRSQVNSQKNAPTLEFGMETSFKVLDHAIDLWHDAVLKDNRKLMLHRSDEINDIIVENIQSNRLQLKMLVRQMELDNKSHSPEGKNLLEGDKHDDLSTVYRELLPKLATMINTKEELFRAISKTETFSNKYRLLGDYKSLLRRELDMPKLNLVEVPKEAPKPTAEAK